MHPTMLSRGVAADQSVADAARAYADAMPADMDMRAWRDYTSRLSHGPEIVAAVEVALGR